jgi:hypothetical protein
MPLRGRARLKSQKIVNDFDFYDWWKALIKVGVQPSEAWHMDFIESAHALDIEPKRTDFTLALYHQRKQNGAPDLEH